MKLLLDTHVVMWAVDEPEKLSDTARQLLEDTTNELLLSAATMWEMSIKYGNEKLKLSAPFRDWIAQASRELDLRNLGISVEHCDTQTRLVKHHKDPFDRLLIAQAIAEDIPVVSADVAFDPYPVRRLW